VFYSPDAVSHPPDATNTVWRQALVVASAVMVMVAACGGPDASTAPIASPRIVSVEPTPAPTDLPSPDPTIATATPQPPPTPTPTLPPVAIPANASVTLTPVLEYPQPIVMAVRPPVDSGEPEIYLAGKLGPVSRIVAAGEAFVAQAPILDIGDRLSTVSEQGLLGMTFSPDGTKLYLDYTDRTGATNVVEWTFDADGSLDMASERQIMRIPQPAANHNAGAIDFGPDGYLYITMGDGGGGGDRYGNGQNRDTLLGSILRIAPDGGEPYAVPADNPFVDGGGRPEIWLYGLRNPWRATFDRATGDLWIGDVGQAEVEEIDVVYASDRLRGGANLGWPLVEGSQGYAGSGPPDDGYLGPIHEYGHSQGCAVCVPRVDPGGLPGDLHLWRLLPRNHLGIGQR
jgi:glucose/arabinose dehydrogenase